MRTKIFPLLLICASLSLFSACGQKGDLFVPKDVPPGAGQPATQSQDAE